MNTNLARPTSGRIAVNSGRPTLSAVIADTGDQAAKRFVGFLTATIRNPNTCRAYARDVGDFVAWCQEHGLALPDIETADVTADNQMHTQNYAAPTTKQRLAAIRMLFDYLVTGQVVRFNLAASVPGPRVPIGTIRTQRSNLK